MYKSTDGGSNWVGIDGNLPDVPVHCILVDPNNSSRLYIGTDIGVFVSVNGGGMWMRENTGFANVITESLAFVTNQNGTTLYAFTHGRGVWKVNTGTGGSTPPLPPANLTATPGNAQVTLNWSPSTGAQSYNVKWSTTSGGPYSIIPVTAAPFTHTGRTNGTPYYYVVSAVSNSNGEGSNSAEVSATPMANPSPPPPPTNLTAMAGNGQVMLTWSPSPGATSYNVKRSTTSGSGYLPVITGLTALGYTDMGLMNGTPYYYVVSASNTLEGPNSAQVSATPTSGGGGGGGTCPQVTSFSGSGVAGYIEGTGTTARWSSPRGGVVAKDPVSLNKAIFIADTDNHRIRMIYLEGSSAGLSVRIAGSGVAGYKAGDNNAFKSQFNFPTGIAASINSNGVVTALFIADTNNHVIRKLLPPPSPGATWDPEPVAGDPNMPPGSTDGTGTAARFNGPTGVAVGPDGFIYVADADNNLIRKITQQGSTSTLLNGAGAGVSRLAGITASQTSGLLYFTDAAGNSIWRLTTGGTATKIAGSGAPGFADGVGLAALFDKLFLLDWRNTSGGEVLYIADRQNHRIRKLVIATSAVTTFAGSGTAGFLDGDCMTARFKAPRGVAAASDTEVYISDAGNNRIRKAQ
ncbi:MAG: hypothetical protein L0229_06725 [Blastocatellia bacterium]|nr:hypothetical protein [Blastocatellia bacterium]